MVKFTVWCRFRPGLQVPDDRDLEWNLVPKQANAEPYQWGYDTYEQASQKAQQFQDNWQPGTMQVVIREVELPD